MDPRIAAIGLAEFLIIIGFALVYARRSLREKDLPRVALLAAGIFVAQMVNFPIGGGTTGHLIGGALMAILVGPTLAIVGMTVVLLIQGLMFGDGGITAFGLNAVNMAIIAPLVGWGAYNLLEPITGTMGKSGKVLAIGMAAWASVFLSAAAAAAELSASYAISGGTYGIAATISVPAMLGYHAVIGVGEALITCGVAAYLWHVSPEMFAARERKEARTGAAALMSSSIVRASLAIFLVFALVVPLYIIYSSEGNDGLEQTMVDAGAGEGEALLASPLSYGESYFEILLAGILGFLAVSLGGLGVLRVLRIQPAKE
jgi:cobalt/nickel transport system permease protein